MKQIKKIQNLYRQCKSSDSSFLMLTLRALYNKLVANKWLFMHQNVTIKGIENINCKNTIEIGIRYVGFIHKSDKTYLNVKGKLYIKGNYSIGRGCRFDIGKDAYVSIGNGGYINANTNLIIKHGLTVGDHCAISWDCQFLDDDFHEIKYGGKKEYNPSIIIGNHVWIGCGTKIYKGTIIPDGCIIASNSIVKGKFDKENTLIGGHPAKILKENVAWE